MITETDLQMRVMNASNSISYFEKKNIPIPVELRQEMTQACAAYDAYRRHRPLKVIDLNPLMTYTEVYDLRSPIVS